MDNISIGKRIKAFRKNKGLTQQQLGEQIGKTESSIRKYEKGLVEIPFGVLKKIATSLDIPVVEILDESTKDMVKAVGSFIVENIDLVDKFQDASDLLVEHEDNNNSPLRNNNILLLLFLINAGVKDALDIPLETISKVALSNELKMFLEYLISKYTD